MVNVLTSDSTPCPQVWQLLSKPWVQLSLFHLLADKTNHLGVPHAHFPGKLRHWNALGITPEAAAGGAPNPISFHVPKFRFFSSCWLDELNQKDAKCVPIMVAKLNSLKWEQGQL